MADNTIKDYEKTLDSDFQPVAESAAKFAHKGYFSSRRGTLPSDGYLPIAYDNNPYAYDKERRGRELTALKEAMFAEGEILLAEASYPTAGEGAGYTIAIVWRCMNGDAAEDLLTSHWERILREEEKRATVAT